MACSDGTPRKDISMLKSLLFPSFRRNRTSHCLPVNCQLWFSRFIMLFCCLITLHWSAGGPVTIVFSDSTTFVHASWSSSSTYSQNHHLFVLCHQHCQHHHHHRQDHPNLEPRNIFSTLLLLLLRPEIWLASIDKSDCWTKSYNFHEVQYMCLYFMFFYFIFCKTLISDENYHLKKITFQRVFACGPVGLSEHWLPGDLPLIMKLMISHKTLRKVQAWQVFVMKWRNQQEEKRRPPHHDWKQTEAERAKI